MTEYVGYPWVRQAWDTNRSYEVFRTYVRMGPGRSLKAAAEAEGSSAKSVIENWSSQHKWAERVAAYDAHMDTAATDGMTSELATIRDRQISVADKLMDLAEMRLTYFISRDRDPTMNVVNAIAVAAKVQQGAISMREDSRTSELMARAAELLERIEAFKE